MLVLTRKPGESILIGSDVRVRVLRAKGSRVRLGIEAPADVRIVREKNDAGFELEIELDANDVETGDVPNPLQSAVERHMAVAAS
ncbi:MAG: carbon storage regulator [Planctomycetota bacterium]|nr:carbon storage regulator [Planctomycetota bacterium]